MVIITKNFKSDCNWFYGCNCNCNRYCNCNWFWHCNCNCNLGFYEKTLIFQTSNFENLIQGIDALSWGEYAGVLRISKIQILPLQIWSPDFMDWCFWFSGTSGTLVLLVLWFSGFLVFWYFVKLGFHFSGVLATEKVRSKCQNDPWGRAQLSRVINSWKLSLFQNPNFGPR